MMVFRVNGLRKEYQGVPIMTDVTFHLAGRERVGLVGANGMWKLHLAQNPGVV